MQTNPIWIALSCFLAFGSVTLLVRFGLARAQAFLRRKEEWFDLVLNRELLMDIPPRMAMTLSLVVMLIVGLLAGYFLNSVIAFVVAAGLTSLLPIALVQHLEAKRRDRLEEQIVDGITTLASGVRAGLNLIQAMELLRRNTIGPIKQEFAQLLREYEMGLDLNQAMRNSAERIGSSHYRLLFTAIEMHRLRGGDAGESLDRIGESIRDIQRLEGKLDAVTAQGRTQAWMMAVMLVFLFGILFTIFPEDTALIFSTVSGRVLLLVAGAMIVTAFIWIRRIMDVDI